MMSPEQRHGNATGKQPVTLHSHAPSGALCVSGLPPYAFGSRKRDWLTSFLEQPLRKAKALILELPPGAPEDGLKTALELAARHNVPLRFIGPCRENVAAAAVDTLQEALEAFSHFPAAAVTTRLEPPGILCLRWHGDLLAATLGVLDRALGDKAATDGGARQSGGLRYEAVAVFLDAKAGGVTLYQPEAAHALQARLQQRLPGRGRVFDAVGHSDSLEFGEEWPRYFPEAFPTRIDDRPAPGGVELHVLGVLTTAEIAEYLDPQAPGAVTVLSLRESAHITPQALAALGTYLEARRKAGCAPLRLEGLSGPAVTRWLAHGCAQVTAAAAPAHVRDAHAAPDLHAAKGERAVPEQAAGSRRTYDVFLSHKTEDFAAAKRVHDFLEARGLNVFLSELSLPKRGDADFQRAIWEAVDACTHMVVVVSVTERAAGRWVQEEWGAFQNEKLSGRKHGNLVTVFERGAVADLPLGLRHNEVIHLDDEGLERLLGYLWKDTAS